MSFRRVGHLERQLIENIRGLARVLNRNVDCEHELHGVHSVRSMAHASKSRHPSAACPSAGLGLPRISLGAERLILDPSWTLDEVLADLRFVDEESALRRFR